MRMTSLVWLRRDLRLADNPALEAAVKLRGPVVPVFIHCPEEEAPWAPGAASRWWLHHSLTALETQLKEIGSRLIIRRGGSLPSLRSLVRETGATVMFYNRRYEPAVIARDMEINEALRRDGLQVDSCNAALLHEPWTIRNNSGLPFQVFTPFWKRCLAQCDPISVISAPKHLIAPSKWPRSLPVTELELEPKINWASGLHAAWHPGEAGAAAKLRKFLAHALVNYSDSRNRPDLEGTSRLSPHLHFGEISPRQVWLSLDKRAQKLGLSPGKWRESQFVAELGWREFAHHLLYHFPNTPAEPLRSGFKAFPWRKNDSRLRAWQKGRTGYPIVDAGMRELWATGWMHNRVRMIVASFLVKDLLISWQEGANWFWDTLVDADLANNTLGWQWIAGCGADATPFFRVFNPVLQGQKFDPNGTYVRRWCPELAGLPDYWIHQPQAASRQMLSQSGVELGKTYCQPVVSHTIAREVALDAFKQIKRNIR